MSFSSVTVKDVMTTKVITLMPEMDVMEAMSVLARHRISGAPVVDALGNVIGMLTERDCLKTVVVASYHGEGQCGAVAEYMSRDVRSVESNLSLLDVAELFVSTKYRRYPVKHQDRLIGIISRKDVIRAVLELA